MVHREGSESGGLACAPAASAPVSHPRSRALVPVWLGVSIRAAAAEPALCPLRPRLLPGLPIYRPDCHVLGLNTMSPFSSLSLQTGFVPWQDSQLPPLALSLVLLPVTETVRLRTDAVVDRGCPEPAYPPPSLMVPGSSPLRCHLYSLPYLYFLKMQSRYNGLTRNHTQVRCTLQLRQVCVRVCAAASVVDVSISCASPSCPL